MSADLSAFVDSNVLVYAVSRDAPAGCTKVLSEDLGDRHLHGGIIVENPFSAK
jgi:predicted nucleic acid-binding protein